MFAVHRRSWPDSPAQLGDYLEDLVLGGCRRTVPKSIVQAFAYVEEKGEVEPSERLAGSAYIRDLLADVEVRMAVGAPARVKAPGYLACQVVALELLVIRDDAPLYLRAAAWVKLVKVWGSLRSDDLAGLAPASVKLMGGGLQGILDRTKTSGPGRKARYLPLYVAIGAYLAVPNWLPVGWEIWASPEFAFKRDYFLPQPDGEWSRPVGREALPYPHMRNISIRIMTELRAPEERGEGWEETEARLLPGVEVAYHKEHSERN